LNYRLLIVLALVLAGVAIWLTLGPRQAGPAAAQASGPTEPEQGYSATDASVVETGADGLPMYTLQARQVRQDPDDDIVDLTDVRMSFRDDAGGQWQARANQAVVRQDSAQIGLSGAIDVAGSFAHGDTPLHLITDALQVDTHTDILRTQSEVAIDSSGKLLYARGLLADLKGHRVKLESQVHGQFTP
jgi:LPS export ABC transporter protein LptC